MKGISLKSLLVAALAVTLSSCEKSAETLESQVAERSVSEVVYPLLGNEMSTGILPKQENLPDGKITKDYVYRNNKVKLISQVCEEYLEGTKKLDISSLKEGAFSKRIKTNDLTIKFSDEPGTAGEGYKKLSNGPQGWWSHWNYSPYTESEYPSVLFASSKSFGAESTMDLTLDKQVTMFGFEVAPNALGEDLEVYVRYQEEYYYRQPNMMEVRQTISSPSGARLIAVKSQVPFQRIVIQVVAGAKKTGFAIANIRYALAK